MHISRDPYLFILTIECMADDLVPLRRLMYIEPENEKVASRDLVKDETIEEEEEEQRWLETPDRENAWIHSRRYNDKEVLRARHHLSLVENSEFADSEVAKRDIAFYKNVLAEFQRWYFSRNLAFPMGEEAVSKESAAERYARLIYQAIETSQSKELPVKAAAFFRLALSEKNCAGEEFKAVRKALTEAGFYLPDRSRTTKELIEDAWERIKSFMRLGVRPEKPQQGTSGGTS